jgi:hypothetical protein
LDRVEVLCTSSTPELRLPDNTYFLYPLSLGVESVKQRVVDPKRRR